MLGCKIENVSGNAVGSGKLEFTGVTVAKPATCAVSGGTVTTLLLRFLHHFRIGPRWLTKFLPNTGTTIATVTLKAGSGSCPLSGSYIVSGNVFVSANNATGVYAASQGFTSSGVINAEGGGELKVGSKSAELTGAGSFALSGARASEVYGARE